MEDNKENTNPVVTEGDMRFVAFRLGEETFCVDVLRIQEVIRETEITPVPGAPGFVLGIINLRGNVVTIVDGRKRFDLQATETDDNSRILILESETETTGLLVDSVSEIVNINSDDIDPAPDTGKAASSEFVYGVTSRNGKLFIIVDTPRLLDACRVEL